MTKKVLIQVIKMEKGIDIGLHKVIDTVIVTDTGHYYPITWLRLLYTWSGYSVTIIEDISKHFCLPFSYEIL